MHATTRTHKLIRRFAAKGELLDRIKSRSKFTEEAARNLFQKMAEVVSFLHAKGVVHRDLKVIATYTHTHTHTHAPPLIGLSPMYLK